MRKILISVCMLLCLINLQAQKQYITNQYVYDLFNLNPAAAAYHKNCTSFNGIFQKQWFGTDLAPTTQMFSFQTAVKGVLGTGTYIYNDRNGNNRRIGIHQAFSYELLLLKKKRKLMTLSFGLAFDGEQASVSESDFTDGAVLDPAITGGNETGWGFNAATGFLLKYNDMHLGVSVDNLLPQNNPMFTSPLEPKLTPNFSIHMGGTFRISERDLYLEPLLMYQRNTSVNSRMDINLKLYMPTPNPDFAVWGLTGYRHTMDEKFGKSLSIPITMGIVFKNFSVGLEYKLGLTAAQYDYGSAYQLVVSYRICRDLKKRAIPCSALHKNTKRNHRFLSF